MPKTHTGTPRCDRPGGSNFPYRFVATARPRGASSPAKTGARSSLTAAHRVSRPSLRHVHQFQFMRRARIRGPASARAWNWVSAPGVEEGVGMRGSPAVHAAAGSGRVPQQGGSSRHAYRPGGGLVASSKAVAPPVQVTFTRMEGLLRQPDSFSQHKDVCRLRHRTHARPCIGWDCRGTASRRPGLREPATRAPVSQRDLLWRLTDRASGHRER